MLGKLKQLIIRVLRITSLLNVADFLLLYVRIAQSYSDNRRYKSEKPGMKFPPYVILFDAAAGCDYRGYYDSGVPDVKHIISLAEEYVSGNELVVAEWGCGPARLVQHIKPLFPRVKRVIGFDYNKNTVEWCKTSIKGVEFYKNELNPPLALENNSVDILYCVSVFTHLSEKLHYDWIREIKRVLKPGGVFIGTFHGEKTKSKLFPDELAKYENGELVVRGNVFEGSKNFVAIHSDEFVREKLLCDFIGVCQVPWPAFHQELYLAIKPSFVNESPST